MVNNAVKSAGINSTPTVLLNGADIGDAVLQSPIHRRCWTSSRPSQGDLAHSVPNKAGHLPRP